MFGYLVIMFIIGIKNITKMIGDTKIRSLVVLSSSVSNAEERSRRIICNGMLESSEE